LTTKNNKIFSLLRRDATAQTVIFSQFAVTLLTVAKHLRNRGVECAVVTGSMTQRKRAESLEMFSKGHVSVLLVNTSLCSGMDLVSANTIIVCEPQKSEMEENTMIKLVWNNGNDAEVITVYKLFTKNTAEETCYTVRKNKPRGLTGSDDYLKLVSSHDQAISSRNVRQRIS
jgi:SNF2 family DNA or RNA helicase